MGTWVRLFFVLGSNVSFMMTVSMMRRGAITCKSDALSEAQLALFLGVLAMAWWLTNLVLPVPPEAIGLFLSLPERSPSIRVPIGYVSPFVERVPIVLRWCWGDRHIVNGFLRCEAVMSTNIYVGNLPFDVTEEAVRDLFSPYGMVEAVKLIADRDTGRLRGFGFVEMSNGGQEAITALNDTELGGRRITVNPAKPRQERSAPRRW
jgi:RNA recognition motif. (a.k.a. RRM, RBD, or RNP domain)